MRFFKTHTLILTALLFGLGACTCSNQNGGLPDQAEMTQAVKDAGEVKGRHAIPLDEITMGPWVEFAELPENIAWQTNFEDPVFSSPEAKRGGVFNEMIPAFPMTLRSVGPDSNSAFANVIRNLDIPLIGMHPNTGNIIPGLATSWAFDEDLRTMYFRLNRNAQWSDGVPVTSGDFAYTIEFMRSPHIIAPWYNNYYTEYIEKVIIYDEQTFAIRSPEPRAEVHLDITIAPLPRHFYGELDENFTQDFNWSIPPVTGPYIISDIRRGQRVSLKRIDDWWGNEEHYMKNRFNVDTIHYRVIRDYPIAWEHFLQGELDSFPINFPDYWWERAPNASQVQNGFIHRLWFYYEREANPWGVYFNTEHPLFSDINVRLGVSHSIDIDAVIEELLRGDYERLENLYSGFGEYTNTNIRARRFDSELAAKYFDKAGFEQRGPDGIRVNERGQRLSFNILYGSDTQTPRLALIRERARRNGVEVNLDMRDSANAFQRVVEKRFEAAWQGWGTSSRPSYWQAWHSDNAGADNQSNNIANAANPELDKLIDRFHSSFDIEERQKLSREIQQVIHDQAYVQTAFQLPYFRFAYWGWWRFPDPPATKRSESPFDVLENSVFWFDPEKKAAIREAQANGSSLEPVTIIDETYRVVLDE